MRKENIFYYTIEFPKSMKRYDIHKACQGFYRSTNTDLVYCTFLNTVHGYAIPPDEVDEYTFALQINTHCRGKKNDVYTQNLNSKQWKEQMKQYNNPNVYTTSNLHLPDYDSYKRKKRR